MFLRRYSVRIGHHREHNFFEKVSKHVFQIAVLHFAQCLKKVAAKRCM